MTDTDLQAVREVLEEFQDGYEHRDTAFLEDFRALFVSEESLEVIGTGAIAPGDEEWCLGPDAVCALIGNDWESWGNVVLDLADARINILHDVAWVAATGTVVIDLEPEQSYQEFLDTVQAEAQSAEPRTAREKLLEILRAGTNTLFEAERGKHFVWPLRFTAVLVRTGSEWLFHQVHFSFATTRFPDVRNI
jgi:hypothetical protein